MPTDITTQISAALDEAGIPAADVIHNDDDAAEAFTINAAGYLLTGGTGPVSIAILGRTSADAVTRLAERDGLAQQAYAALDAAGFDAKINVYGNLIARERLQSKEN
ncbi:hypothetical protein [Streptomyces sp. NPDC059761]|uniref:hypothetical protein n=1 Tax=Streptomyces sp. NPDC059761 TaxID=3346937 RepID=UPI003658F5F1